MGSTISIYSPDDDRTYSIYVDAVYQMDVSDVESGKYNWHIKMWSPITFNNQQYTGLIFNDLTEGGTFNNFTELIEYWVDYIVNWGEIVASSSSSDSSSSDSSDSSSSSESSTSSQSNSSSSSSSSSSQSV